MKKGRQEASNSIKKGKKGRKGRKGRSEEEKRSTRGIKMRTRSRYK